MHALAVLASLVFLATTVHASIYVTNPVQASTCTGGQSCSVQWVDNGESPLLNQIGECTVGLYTGELQLVQSLPSVDVSTTSSFSFTPDPAVGSNGAYYVVFTSNSISYQGFSASFTLTGMSGTTPSGGSSTTGSATTLAGSSTPAGSTTPTGTATDTGVSTLSGSTAATGTTSPILTTPAASTTASSTTHTTTPVTTTSASASATPSSAAVRAGSSTSLGGIAALLVLSGVLAF